MVSHQYNEAMEKESDDLTAELQELRATLEKVQTQQSEDSRNTNRQQKTTERYLAKRQMLTGRKDECNRNIRDLGVLPEEAFEKYINEKPERVCWIQSSRLMTKNSFPNFSLRKNFRPSTKV
jgi:structural maintenance of chromosome 3 (chondroitin sulfate proteoglycan 6)